MSGHALHQVIVIPRNGYINRLQAWASAAILGDALQVPTRLLWEAESAAPGGVQDLFDPALLDHQSIRREEVDALLGCEHEQLPRYLHAYPDRQVLVLAGHDRGEQAFMQELLSTLQQDSSLHSLVIIAGGQFHHPREVDFDQRRRDFYRAVPWNSQLNDRVHAALDQRDPYIALHIRQTDRSTTAPTDRAIRGALGQLAEQNQSTSLFVAADTQAALDTWHATARGMHLEPWSAPDPVHDRTAAAGAVGAMLDWRILGAADGLVYSRESSFGHEAATVIGRPGMTIGLTASASRQQARQLTARAKSAVTYPRRMLGG